MTHLHLYSPKSFVSNNYLSLHLTVNRSAPGFSQGGESMACLNRASPALSAILSVDTSNDVLSNFVQASATDFRIIYLSILTPPLSSEVSVSNELPSCTLQDIKRVYNNIAEILEPPKEGFVLTLKLDLAKLPQKKDDCLKAINEISSLQAVILSSQLKEMVCNVGCEETGRRFHRPIKLVCHPKEPFFVIRMPEKVTAIFPMRFRDHSDVVIATSFFQELMDVGYSTADAKAPRCTWSPIPPPELRGEYVRYLTTNGGFVSFDIFLEHFKGAKAEKILWTLLNFNAYVKYHVKSTRGFIQRKMRQHLRSLTEVIQNARIGREQNNEKLHSHKFAAKMKTSSSKSMALKRKCSAFAKQINRIRLHIKIKGLGRLRRRWFRVPKITSFKKHPKTA